MQSLRVHPRLSTCRAIGDRAQNGGFRLADFYLRALIEERMGAQADWNAVDSLMQKALAAAEKVARYRHAQLSAVRLAGDINAKNYDDVTLDDRRTVVDYPTVEPSGTIIIDTPNTYLFFT
jgi:hypothetical protein